MKLGVDLSQSEVDDHASFGLRVVEEISRLNISMVDAKFLEVSESDEQFKDVVFDLFQREGVEESLSYTQCYDKGLEFEVFEDDVGDIVVYK